MYDTHQPSTGNKSYCCQFFRIIAITELLPTVFMIAAFKDGGRFSLLYLFYILGCSD